MRAIFILAGFAALLTGMTHGAAAQNAPGKHVWTNDDVLALRDKAPVSVLGEPLAKTTDRGKDASAETAAAEQRQQEKIAQRYRRQLQPLHGELAKIESEIAEMRRWQDGSYRMTGVWPLRFAGMPLNPADRIAQLETRGREVRERIGNLEDAARHAGVLPGELR